MFTALNPFRQARGGIVLGHRDAGLGDQRAAVQFLGHEMHRAAVFVVAGFQGAGVGIEALVLGQQGRVNVDQTAGVVVHEQGRENTHKTGQHHGVGAVLVDARDHGGVEGGAVGVITVVDHRAGNARARRPLQATGCGFIAQHQGDAGRQGAGLHRIQNRLQIGAGATDQHRDPVGHVARPSSSTSGAAESLARISPITNGVSPPASSNANAWSR